MLKDRHSRQTVETGRISEMALGGRGGEAAAVSVDGMEVGEDGGLAVLVGHLLNIGEGGCFRLVIGFL